MKLPLTLTELSQALPRAVVELPRPVGIAGAGAGKLQSLEEEAWALLRSPGTELHRMGPKACLSLLGDLTSTSVEVGDGTVNLKSIP